MSETKAVFRNLVLGAVKTTFLVMLITYAILYVGSGESLPSGGLVTTTSQLVAGFVAFFIAILGCATLLQLASYYLPIRPVAKTEECGSQ